MSMVTVSTPRLHRLSAPRIRHHEARQRGFTLLEMLLVLFMMALVASAGLMLTEGVEDQAKYDETKRRMALIRTAIVGDPTRTVNGTPEISGFVADMGRLPNDLRELLEPEYCYKDFATEAACNANSATWYETQTYKFGDCSDPAYVNKSDCESASETWTAYPAGMAVGWRGPYLQVLPEQDGTLHLRDGFGNSGKNTETATSDQRNSGWDYQTPANGVGLASEGFDIADSADDIADPNFIVEDDWTVDLSPGLEVNFVKPYQLHQLVSKCSDPTKVTKATCTSPLTWFGGCNQAGYFNKSSCENASGTWSKCSDGTSTDPTTCGTNIWFGEGYGCSDQSKTTKATCLSPNVWRSCTDNGTITDKATCATSNEIWFGDSLYTVPLSSPHTFYPSKNICLIVYYRDAGAISWIKSAFSTVAEDGGQMNIRFSAFTDSSGATVTQIPIGKHSIGIYEFDGDCDPSNTFYPADRTAPTNVVFQPRTHLGTIHW